MKILQELFAHYDTIDTFLDDQLAASEDAVVRDRIEKMQRVNDQAYFVLFWGQLEALVDDTCREAIRKRFDNPDWTKRRAWDLYNPDDKRLSGLSFEERASLVLDRKQGRGGEWALLIRYYNVRNHIAHGGVYPDRIDMNEVITDFFRIASRLAS